MERLWRMKKFNEKVNHINNYAKTITKLLWNMELDIEIKVPTRFMISNGQFHTTHDDKPLFIKLCRRLLKKEDYYIPILIHELTHWRNCKLGLNFDDGAEEFENELQRVNAPSNYESRSKSLLTNESNEFELKEEYKQLNLSIMTNPTYEPSNIII